MTDEQDAILQRMVQQALPKVTTARRRALRRVAAAALRATPEQAIQMVLDLLRETVERERKAGADEMSALAVASTEVVIISRELHRLTLRDAQPKGSG